LPICFVTLIADKRRLLFSCRVPGSDFLAVSADEGF
jgi:hypothetical protein